jgi:O-acetyl-ADP-ribose deacetylase (regulator of RNase III)
MEREMTYKHELIEGDLLDSDARYIVHQCNCMSVGSAAGIARVIFERFPWADCYKRRGGGRPPMYGQMPGDIQICGSGTNQRLVVNLFGQFYPGGPSETPLEIDFPEHRKQWFDTALNRLGREVQFPDDGDSFSVAFPWQIGCGIAGGDWEGFYLPRIDEFAMAVGIMGIRTLVYRLPGI